MRYLIGGSDVGYILSAGRGDVKYQPISLRPNNERLHGPPPDVQPARCAHAMKRSRAEQRGDNQVDRARVLEFESIPLQRRESATNCTGGSFR